MTQFINAGKFSYHVDGDFVPRTNQYHVAFHSKFTASRDPEYHRKLLSLILQPEELDVLIAELVKIRAAEPVALETV